MSAGRRALLEKLALGTGLASLAAIAWPPLAALLSPALSDDEAAEAPFVDVADEREVRQEPVKLPLRAPVRDGFFTVLQDLGAVWLSRTASGVQALSATCPHLGCGIERKGAGFACPCHASHFTQSGARDAGPSPRGMDPLPVRVEGGRVLVQALRFATGTSARRRV